MNWKGLERRMAEVLHSGFRHRTNSSESGKSLLQSRF